MWLRPEMLPGHGRYFEARFLAPDIAANRCFREDKP